MPVEIKVPSVGESVTEGILSCWLKKDGDAVHADEPVVELETDKATQEVVAPVDGRLRIAVAEGTTVQVGAVIARIEEGARRRPSNPPRRCLNQWPPLVSRLCRHPRGSMPKPAASIRAN